MSESIILLVDNGSRRAASTLALRSIAARLTEAVGREVHPVSLQHADAIPADQLEGRPADTFSAFVRGQVEQDRRTFVILPLFFGQSRALTSYIPDSVDALRHDLGRIDVHVADPLVPLPGGEPRLADILLDHVLCAGVSLDAGDNHIVVVDHGSPLAQVNEVRRWVVDDLRQRLPVHIRVDQAVMERRDGAQYDFNGELLADVLDRLAASGQRVSVAVVLLFLLPGRHAGPDGDITGICADAITGHPGLEVALSPLVGDHPLLVDILRDRLEAAAPV